MFQPNTILVPTDFSEFSERAFRNAIDISKPFSAKIYVLHVVEELPLRVGDYYMDVPAIKRIQIDIEKASKEEIANFINKFPEAKGMSIEADTKSGVTYEQIVKDAVEKGVDLIAWPSQRPALGASVGGTADRSSAVPPAMCSS
jgi:nucleotide-binding universal stress UspA family protein